jgi:hypothetical protein
MTWDKLDAKRKTLIFLTAVAIAVLWLMWPSGTSRPKRLPVRAPVRQAPKALSKLPVNRAAQPAATPAAAAPARSSAAPVRAAAVPVAPAPAPPIAPVVSAPFNALLGQYVGREMLSTGRGTCVLRLELRRSDKAGEFSGFTNLVCTPPLSEVMAQNKMRRPGLAVDARSKAANPTAATLSGTAVDGSIRLQAVKNFGVRDARDGCAMTALNVTPGGTNVIDVDWQESVEDTGLCRGAQMQMRKVAR